MKHDFRKRELAPLKTVPENLPCNCIECQKTALYAKQFGDRMKGYGSGHDTSAVKFSTSEHDPSVDNADAVNAHGEKITSPEYWLDLPLVASKPVKVWTLPGASKGGVVKKTVNVGESIGTVKDFVKDKNGVDYWFILNEGGYTPFLQGYFDEGLAKTAVAANDSKVAAKIDAAVKVRQDNNTSALYQTGKALKDAIPDLSDLTGLFDKLKWVFYVIIAIMVVAVFLRISGK